MNTIERNTKLTILQPERVKRKIKTAAALRGMSVTSFVNGTLERAADRTIDRVRVRELSERDSEALMDLLRHPAKPNAALLKAIKRHREILGGKESQD